MEPPPTMGQSFAEFRKAFPDEASCAAYISKPRWPGGFICLVGGGRRYASLTSRAYTYECLDYGRQTSITAGTVMHRSKLPLVLWFSAAHLIAAHPDGVPARQFESGFGIAYQTAWMLKRKLQLWNIAGEDEPLQGIVEVNQTEIPFRDIDGFLEPAKSAKSTIAAALDLTSYQIRLGEIPDPSTASIEAFVRANVNPGAILRTNSCPGLRDYRHDPEPWDPQTPTTFGLLRQYRRRRREPIGVYLARFVLHHNAGQNSRRKKVSFDSVLGLALRNEPTSYRERGTRRRLSQRRSPTAAVSLLAPIHPFGVRAVGLSAAARRNDQHLG